MNLHVTVQPQVVQKESAASLRGSYLTFNRIIPHAKHGMCRKLIYRRIGNDNGVASKLTKKALAKKEPQVGIWPGDIVQYKTVGGSKDEDVIKEIASPP